MKSFFSVISGIIGCYHIDFTLYFGKEVNDWHFVTITWNRERSAFTWQNKAGATWTLKPIIIDGEWDTTKLAVGVDCPYYAPAEWGDGYKFADLEWEGVPGSSNVSTIRGPSGPYLGCSYNQTEGMDFPPNAI